jgi:tRNA(Ile)-lysidine synthetase-like protein
MDELYKFWFAPENERVWFQATPEDDKIITEKFGYLLSSPGRVTGKDSIWLNVAHIILFDQVYRHIVRHTGIDRSDSFTYIALSLTDYNVLEYIGIDRFSNKEIPFVLLPLRHTCNKKNIERAKNIIIDVMAKREGSKDFSYLRRFYQATIRQLSKMNIPVLFNSGDISDERYEAIKKIIDKESIYEIGTPKVSIPSDNRIMMELLSALRTISKDSHLILSVSGGKDSMCLATALFVLRKQGFIKCNISGVHINYGNRDTSNAEEDLVSEYVGNILKIPLYYRRITEIQRSRHSVDRDFYETITKEIRFNTYQHVAGDNPNSYVILGHNHDDTIENIITNITKKKHYDNLKGMTMHSEQLGVKIFRPLLNVTKTEIESFNKYTQTPFTYDSTPDWSDRGRIRDNVVTALKKFNPATLDGLIEVSNTLTEMDEMYRIYALPNIFKLIRVNEETKRIEIPYNNVPFSVKVYRDIFDNFNVMQPSSKSLINLINQLKICNIPDKIRYIKLNELVIAKVHVQKNDTFIVTIPYMDNK